MNAVQIPFKFDGATYHPGRDHERLAAQYQRVFQAMADGKWWTPEQLEIATGDRWASISARIRDFRKQGHTVERRYVVRGLFEYRLVQESETPGLATERF